ncbi:hypothetical protein [Chitinophaga silvisoli]|uniref:Uncharacterized protein n=1 Tax=Chitinophaga silvisoli TaxID=2291814 RepID=A0A3E1NX80_9BACT|nr:hypothetical protein [Chitinophaga silvisoli]RFM32368.1 hypothetical protein DXN04_22020 [Chitinophaga silvisoli]
MVTKFRIIFLSIAAIVGITWFRMMSKEHDRLDQLLTNHVRFSGRVVSYKVSNYHAFGIIGIILQDTNTKEFADTSSQRLFPYKIKGAFAEFYGYVPPSIKEGDAVILDSDKRLMNIYDDHNPVIVLNVVVSTESDEMDFVRRYTMFK